MAAPSAEQLLQLAVKQIENEIPDGDLPAATLARRIGLPYQRVYRWFRPGNGPDYEGAMAILDAFGWLQISEEARAGLTLPRDPLEGIQDGIAQLLLGQAEAFELLERAIARGQTTQKPAAQKKRAARRARP